MKVKILLENTSVNEKCAAAHGLSVFIETEKHKVLVDAGPDALFLKNAMALGTDLTEVDTFILSHGHYDHAGGLTEFMRINKTAKIYAAEGFDRPHYSETGKYIGVEPVLVNNPRIQVVSGNFKIDDELSLLCFNFREPVVPINNGGMKEGRIMPEGTVALSPERFDHEQYLMVSENGNNVLFSGCTHKGIVNAADWVKRFKVSAIFGGFHFMNVRPEEFGMLKETAEALLKFPYTYYTCHCTGKDQFDFMKEIMGDRLIYAAGGDEFEL